MAISRTREYYADQVGSEICGEPRWLISALEKLENSSKNIENIAAEEHPSTAHLFIINPIHSHSIDNLFSTHPSTAKRVEKLRKLTSYKSGALNLSISKLDTGSSVIPRSGKVLKDWR